MSLMTSRRKLVTCSGSDKDMRPKVTGIGQQHISDQMKQEAQKQAAVNELEESYEYACQLKQDRFDFEQEYLSESERCRANIVQTDKKPDFSVQNLLGENKVKMLSLNNKTNAVVHKINKGAAEPKKKFGVTHQIQSGIDEPEWMQVEYFSGNITHSLPLSLLSLCICGQPSQLRGMPQDQLCHPQPVRNYSFTPSLKIVSSLSIA